MYSFQWTLENTLNNCYDYVAVKTHGGELQRSNNFVLSDVEIREKHEIASSKKECVRLSSSM